MSDYSKTTDFTAKDNAASGQATKLILGADFDLEFGAVATAVNSKYDSGDLASEVQAQNGTDNTVLMTPLRTEQWSATWAAENGGMIGDIQALADPNADRILFWDDSAGAAALLTVSTGLTISGTNLTTNDGAIVHDSLSGFVANEHIDHSGVSVTAGSGMTGGGAITSTVTLNVIGGNGITANANDIALTDQSVTSSVPVGLSSGSLTFDLSSITELTMPNFSQSADKILVSDAGTLKVMPYDEAGIKVATVTGTSDTLAAGDMNTFIEYTSASAVTVTLNTGVGTVGNVVLIKQTGAGQVTIAGTATVESADSLVKTRTTDSVICLVCIAANTWALYGDLGS